MILLRLRSVRPYYYVRSKKFPLNSMYEHMDKSKVGKKEEQKKYLVIFFQTFVETAIRDDDFLFVDTTAILI